MNQYLYPWYSQNGDIKIGSVKAKNYTDCLEKLSNILVNKYDQLDDTLQFEELLDQLEDLYGIYIGDIYDINELM